MFPVEGTPYLVFKFPIAHAVNEDDTFCFMDDGSIKSCLEPAHLYLQDLTIAHPLVIVNKGLNMKVHFLEFRCPDSFFRFRFFLLFFFQGYQLTEIA